MSMKFVGSITSLLPHWKIKVPCRFNYSFWMKAYIDTELGHPFGLREPVAINSFLEEISEGDVIMDIGGYLGVYTLLSLGKPNTYVHVFEPSSKNYERLKENIILNDLEQRVSLNQVAVWDDSGYVELGVGSHDSQHSVLRNSGDKIKSVSTSIDDYIEETKINPDMIKLDAEGGGHHVLQGASTTIKTHRPKWILEIHNDQEETAYELLAVEHDYEIEWITDSHIFANPL